MLTGPPTRLKVCCIQDKAEALLAVALGADALGLVAEMPTGPGPICDEAIREIAAVVPPPVATFLLTSRTTPDAVVDHVRFCRCNTVQLVDAVPIETYAALRSHCPAVRIVQVIHVQDEQSLEEAALAAPHVDALLLDSGRTRTASPPPTSPQAQTLSPAIAKAADALPFPRELGGTGRTHDWSLSARIVRDSPVPIFLAGGLRPDNVALAVATVRPFGVDLCNGVRTLGRLDEAKLQTFRTALRSAFT